MQNPHVSDPQKFIKFYKLQAESKLPHIYQRGGGGLESFGNRVFATPVHAIPVQSGGGNITYQSGTQASVNRAKALVKRKRQSKSVNRNSRGGRTSTSRSTKKSKGKKHKGRTSTSRSTKSKHKKNKRKQPRGRDLRDLFSS